VTFQAFVQPEKTVRVHIWGWGGRKVLDCFQLWSCSKLKW